MQDAPTAGFHDTNVAAVKVPYLSAMTLAGIARDCLVIFVAVRDYSRLGRCRSGRGCGSGSGGARSAGWRSGDADAVVVSEKYPCASRSHRRIPALKLGSGECSVLSGNYFAGIT